MMDFENLLSEIPAVLIPYGIEKIILFGSYASGMQKSNSDIDLLVIKKIPANQTRDFSIKLKKALWMELSNFNYSFDILVDDEQRIQERIAIGDLFYKDIFTNGKVIYASPKTAICHS
ncbi:MAG: nucleotidyltransferase domain-containing protein [Bacteroidia bacterium]|nr:nucleotidyltransferase domain-containing protein [Bacteroidia bacterium]